MAYPVTRSPLYWRVPLIALFIFALFSSSSLVPNDNRRPAGRLSRGVLTLGLEARVGTWHPEGETGPGIEIAAFGESGKPLQIPGPLIRVPSGTDVRLSLTNRLRGPLFVRVLHDSVDLRAGETREIRFRASAPGTYYYWGRTVGDHVGPGLTDDSQLVGAFVVDPPGAPTLDRVIVLTMWIHPADTTLPLGRRREALAMNGLSWPHTERLAYAVGDSVRWRVINGTIAGHPMHLHGFYFQVGSRGDGVADTVYAPAQRRLAVTEFMERGTTMTLRWSPTRPGNWLFHCHLIAHISPLGRLEPGARHSHASGSLPNHAFDEMGGLVMGMRVTGRLQGFDAIRPPPTPRALRLFAQERKNYFGAAPGYGFVLQEGSTPPAPDSIRIPGTPIVLRQGEPVAITVANRTDGFVTVHWHGIELDSYYDGVGDWSGGPQAAAIAPPIAPGDSFLVRFTPLRAGTFIYHTHQDESQQLASGLYGSLIVLPAGATRDTTTDVVFLVGRGGPGPQAAPLLNGSTAPAPLDWKVGATYRLRLINITPSDRERIALLADSTVQAWRAFAKDGADLPSHQRAVRPAEQQLGAGETYDFDFTPTLARDFSLAATIFSRGRPIGTIRVPIRVRD
jgi:FtsP/CotA-like multicopper oxidase with cupredoxin domain